MRDCKNLGRALQTKNWWISISELLSQLSSQSCTVVRSSMAHIDFYKLLKLTRVLDMSEGHMHCDIIVLGWNNVLTAKIYWKFYRFCISESCVTLKVTNLSFLLSINVD